MNDFHGTFSDLLRAANLRHGTDGFTSPPKEGVPRIFTPLKIRRLRPGLNPRTWVLKANTLPLDHRSRLPMVLNILDVQVTVHHDYFIIGIQPLGRSGQRPEHSQATGMALVRCILGNFLGVVCHCFSPRLDVHTFATRCPHIRHDARDPSCGRWNCGREYCPVILPK
jgi:hypothetical protein